MSTPFTDPAGVFVVVVAIILLAPIVAERARAPGIIGLIGAGMLVGPHGLGLIERDGAIALLGGVGLLYLMFLGGLDLDLEGFAELARHDPRDLRRAFDEVKVPAALVRHVAKQVLVEVRTDSHCRGRDSTAPQLARVHR